MKSDDLVYLAQNPVRRIMFFILFLLLGVSMAFAVNPDTDFSGTNLLRTIGYSAVLLVLLGASAWSTVTSFDRDGGSIQTIFRLFGITVRSTLLARMDRVEGVVLQKVALLRENAPYGGRSGVFGNLFTPPAELVRLFLDTDERRINLDEGDSVDKLEKVGIFFAQFLDVEFSREELEREG